MDRVDPATAPPLDSHRRRLLQGTLAGIGLAWLSWDALLARGASAPAAAGIAANADWNQLVQWLTAVELDAAVLLRGHQALAATRPDVESNWPGLLEAMRRDRLHDPDALAASPLFHQPTERATALAIISAFYLGHAGQGDGQQLVSFEQALIYPPTLDVTVIPTYARGGYNDWVDAPTVRPAEGQD